ncbi:MULTISPECIES: hypothetical protein [unclassified Streptomyces]|nr:MULTISPECIES: hypothetical protein [unclassified Streptomyces]
MEIRASAATATLHATVPDSEGSTLLAVLADVRRSRSRTRPGWSGSGA